MSNAFQFTAKKKKANIFLDEPIKKLDGFLNKFHINST